MRATTLLGVSMNAIVVGLALTLLTGDDRVVSLEVWLAIALAWTMLLTGRAANRLVPTVPSQVRPVLQRSVPDPGRPDARTPKELRSLEQIVTQSLDEPRIYAAQLRPRLERLIAGRGRDVLPPDLRWMLDPSVARAPTVDDVDRFVDAATRTPEHLSGER